jgi:hypothetical protein
MTRNATQKLTASANPKPGRIANILIPVRGGFIGRRGWSIGPRRDARLSVGHGRCWQRVNFSHPVPRQDINILPRQPRRRLRSISPG